MATDLNGLPYTPTTPRTWLTDAIRADFARQFDCAPAEVEYRLDAREAMDAYIAERMEREHPYSHRRPGARLLTTAEMVF